MARADQETRTELAGDGSLFQGYHPRMEEVHVRNGTRLLAILEARGWPGASLVGEDGAEAAWLVAQHAISMPALQRRALELIDSPRQAAYLEDRIRVLEGRPQRYGTQLDWDETGTMSPEPIEDPAGVEERRRAAGLPPLAEVLERLRTGARAEGERPPADWAARRREKDAWARRIGWRER